MNLLKTLPIITWLFLPLTQIFAGEDLLTNVHGKDGKVAFISVESDKHFLNIVANNQTLVHKKMPMNEKVPKKERNMILCANFSSSGKLLALGDRFGHVYVYKLSDDSFVTLGKKDGLISHCGFTMDEKFAYGSSPSYMRGSDRIHLWDLQNKKLVRPEFDFVHQMYVATVLDKNRFLYSATKGIFFVDQNNKKNGYVIKKRPLGLIWLSPNKKTWMVLDNPPDAVGKSWGMRIFETKSGKLLADFEVCKNDILTCPCFSDNSDKIVYARSQQHYRIYDLKSKKTVDYLFKEIDKKAEILSAFVHKNKIQVYIRNKPSKQTEKNKPVNFKLFEQPLKEN